MFLGGHCFFLLAALSQLCVPPFLFFLGCSFSSVYRQWQKRRLSLQRVWLSVDIHVTAKIENILGMLGINLPPLLKDGTEREQG